MIAKVTLRVTADTCPLLIRTNVIATARTLFTGWPDAAFVYMERLHDTRRNTIISTLNVASLETP